jgi:hypothetical protein
MAFALPAANGAKAQAAIKERRLNREIILAVYPVVGRVLEYT